MVAELDVDPEYDKALITRAREATGRWTTRQASRDTRSKALSEERYLDADSPSRIALRLNRLVNNVRVASRDRRPPSNPLLRDLVERTTPIAPEDLSEDLVKEVVIGARDFLSIEFLERGVRAARSIGRILIQTGGNVRPRGTGFLISPALLITNHHVLRTRDQAASCSVQMGYEQRFGPQVQPEVFRLEPNRFFLNDEKLDFALVAVAQRSALGASLDTYGWLPLNGAQGKIVVAPEDCINIVQHPLGREKEVVLRNNRLLDLATRKDDEAEIGPFLHYEGDTEKGSSGSPVFNDQWEVVGLHHSGVPKTDASGNWLTKKNKVWVEGKDPVEDIAWIANEGTRTSSLIAHFSKTTVDPNERDLLAQVLAAQASGEVRATPVKENTDMPVKTQPQRVSAGEPRNERVSAPPPSQAVPGTLSFEVPLRVTVSLGDQGSSALRPAPATLQRARSELLEEALSAEDYADRKGFDRRFLGANVPFPKIKNSTRFGGLLEVPRPARPNDKFELRYHRFSILMNKRRRLAYVSACNLNFDPPASVSRDEGSQSWRRDPRLDGPQQVGGPYYDDNEYDKGHLTRRDDAAWGEDKDAALAANWDTFHYTNAAPQHSLFNRSDDFTHAGLDLWGDLENHISKQGAAQRTRLCVFSGPVFGEHDKRLKDILVPLSYFKIVVWRDGTAKPGALGFILDQSDLIANLPEEAIDPGDFVVRQKRISVIEDLLDISFDSVTAMDRTPTVDPNEALGDDILKSVDDIRGASPLKKA